MQGFMSIGEVDTKGRARRLPIKANIRRALCFPGGSTLMVSNLIEDKSANLEEPVKPFSFLKSLDISLPSVLVENHEVGGLDETSAPVNAVNQMLVRTECSQPQDLVKNGFQMDGRCSLVFFFWVVYFSISIANMCTSVNIFCCFFF